MLHFSRFKITFIIALCLLAIWFALPSFIKHSGGHNLSFLPDQRVNLGLDLQGGSYLLLEVDFNSYLLDQLDLLRSDIRSTFRENKIDGKRIRYTGGLRIQGNGVNLTLNDSSTGNQVARLIKKLSTDITVDVNGPQITATYTDTALKEMRRKLLQQSIEIVRRRVDETGTREPDIQIQGENRILLQVPGLKDPDQLKRLLGKTAKMSFHLLDNTMPYPDNSRRAVPPGSKRLKEDKGPDSFTIRKKVMISGELLVDARPDFNLNGQPVVTIRFNSLGAKKFGEITKQNVGKPFAIVLDDKVITAPRINSVILGGTAEISGNFTTQEATDMSILLRAGALPAPLEIVEERTVGPSLGADSIAAGKAAIAIGIVLVIIFMAVNYGLFGIMSDIALIINIIMIIAIISAFGATLTLPGIAGIVLTMGMAVDANVLIFERIREEVRLGKTAFAAVDNGFSLAFRTILDSNITTLIAAAILYSFGSGPIKGFAVTLSVGILCSMFSAILLTRLMVVTWLLKKRPSELPI